MVERIALVTGAGGGIGRVVSAALAATGWHLVLAGRHRPALERTAAELGSAAVAIQPTDVTDPASVSALFDAVASHCGRLDLLFNNAGTDVPGVPFEDVSFDDWTKILATNLSGQFLCAQGAFRMMKTQSPAGGRIINNGSIAAHAPRPNSIPYAASKHGVTGLTKGLMIDGRRHGIAACQIDIGNATVDPHAPRSPSLQADGSTVVEPFMSFTSVAKAVVFMADLPPEANAAFVTVMATAMPFVGRG